jgi:excisionase family DNA binding protein
VAFRAALQYSTLRRTVSVAEKYLSIPEIAAILGTTDRFPRRLIEERRIEFKRFGRHVRVAESVLRSYIDSCTVAPVSRRGAARMAA